MARSIPVIKQQMINEYNTNQSLGSLNSPSLTALWNLWIYLCAMWINLCEQGSDLLYSDTNTRVVNQIPFTAESFYDKILAFQYGDTVQINSDYTVGYATIDKSKQIVTRATLVSGGIYMRVSKEVAGVITPLTIPEMSRLKAYANQICQIGAYYDAVSASAWNSGTTYAINNVVSYNGSEWISLQNSNLNNLPQSGAWWTSNGAVNLTTTNPDFVTFEANISYDARYYQTIQQSVFDTLTDYYKNPPYGIIDIVSVLERLNAITGIKKVDIIEVAVRFDGDPYSAAQTAYSHVSGTGIQGNLTGIFYSSCGGMIQETTATHTWADTITFKAE